MNLILLGPPASGKGTQSNLLLKNFDFIHFSTGEIIRKNINNQTEFGIKFKKIVNSGKLVPDSLIIDIVKNYLKNDLDKNIIFDGFPRTLKQAKFLDDFLIKNNQKIDIVINFELSYNILLKRALSRMICQKCGSLYNSITNKPKVAKICDFDKCKIVVRNDDDEKKIALRLKEYNNLTVPLIKYYEDKKILYKINSNNNHLDVFNKIKGIINDNN